MGNGLRQAIVDNAGFALVALVTVAVLIAVAYFFEKMAARRAAGSVLPSSVRRAISRCTTIRWRDDIA